MSIQSVDSLLFSLDHKAPAVAMHEVVEATRGDPRRAYDTEVRLALTGHVNDNAKHDVSGPFIIKILKLRTEIEIETSYPEAMGAESMTAFVDRDLWPFAKKMYAFMSQRYSLQQLSEAFDDVFGDSDALGVDVMDKYVRMHARETEQVFHCHPRRALWVTVYGIRFALMTSLIMYLFEDRARALSNIVALDKAGPGRQSLLFGIGRVVHYASLRSVAEMMAHSNSKAIAAIVTEPFERVVPVQTNAEAALDLESAEKTLEGSRKHEHGDDDDEKKRKDVVVGAPMRPPSKDVSDSDLQDGDAIGFLRDFMPPSIEGTWTPDTSVGVQYDLVDIFLRNPEVDHVPTDVPIHLVLDLARLVDDIAVYDVSAPGNASYIGKFMNFYTRIFNSKHPRKARISLHVRDDPAKMNTLISERLTRARPETSNYRAIMAHECFMAALYVSWFPMEYADMDEDNIVRKLDFEPVIWDNILFVNVSSNWYAHFRGVISTVGLPGLGKTQFTSIVWLQIEHDAFSAAARKAKRAFLEFVMKPFMPDMLGALEIYDTMPGFKDSGTTGIYKILRARENPGAVRAEFLRATNKSWETMCTAWAEEVYQQIRRSPDDSRGEDYDH